MKFSRGIFTLIQANYFILFHTNEMTIWIQYLCCLIYLFVFIFPVSRMDHKRVNKRWIELSDFWRLKRNSCENSLINMTIKRKIWMVGSLIMVDIPLKQKLWNDDCKYQYLIPNICSFKLLIWSILLFNRHLNKVWNH